MSVPEALQRLLHRWERKTRLTDADSRAVLELPRVSRTFERDAYIVREGEPVAHCHLLTSGFAFRQKVANTGNRQIVAFHIAGEFVDLQNAVLYVAEDNVQSLGRSELVIVPKQALVQLMSDHPNIARALWLDTMIDSSIFREWVVNVGRRDARSRIAHLLCELVLRLRSAGLCPGETCDFPLTQEQLADATGMTPVHTNRVLQKLRQEGLINLASHRLTVLDRERLMEVGDFSERYLHHGI